MLSGLKKFRHTVASKLWKVFVVMTYAVTTCFVTIPKTHATTFSNEPDTEPFVTDGSVYTMAINQATHTGYLGGSFNYAGPYTERGVVADFTSSSILSSAVHIQGDVKAVVKDGAGGWYVGGDFSKVNNETHYNLVHIKSDYTLDADFNPEPDGQVLSLLYATSSLYAAGEFSVIGGQNRIAIAKLATSTGSADVGFNAVVDGAVNATLLTSDGLYLGGAFSNVGGQLKRRLARVVPATGAVDEGFSTTLNNQVLSLATDGINIYAAGSFTLYSGEASIPGLIKLDTAGSLDNDFYSIIDFDNQQVTTVVYDNGNLYVGGEFSMVNGEPGNHLAKFNTVGVLDATFVPNSSGNINTLALQDGYLYVGGNFTTFNSVSRNYLVKTNTTTGALDPSWSMEASGVVNVIASDGVHNFVGGSFLSIGGSLHSNVLKFDTNTYVIDTSFDPGFIDGIVSKMVLNGSSLYLGGGFSTIDLVSAPYLAKVNATTGALDTNFTPNPDTPILEIMYSSGSLYAGGSFTTIGGLSRTAIAKLDPLTGVADASFNAIIANASTPEVHVIVASGGELYVGGYFDTSSAQDRVGLTRVGAESGATDMDFNAHLAPDSIVDSLLVSGLNLYVGGVFDTVNGNTVHNLTKVNGSTGAVDTGFGLTLDGTVKAIIKDGADLYIGGSFTEDGEPSTQGFAKISAADGTYDPAFMPFYIAGSNVYAMAYVAEKLYISGAYMNTGSTNRSYFSAFTGTGGGDTDAPVITILGSNPVTITVGDTYSDAGATALDDVDGDLTGAISVTSTVNTAVAGDYTVTYSVSDAALNLDSAVRTVHVVVSGGGNSHAGYSPPLPSFETPSRSINRVGMNTTTPRRPSGPIPYTVTLLDSASTTAAVALNGGIFLNITAPTSTIWLALSKPSDPTFIDTQLIAFTNTAYYNLCENRVPCTDGPVTVFVRFYNPDWTVSRIIPLEVILKRNK